MGACQQCKKILLDQSQQEANMESPRFSEASISDRPIVIFQFSSNQNNNCERGVYRQIQAPRDDESPEKEEQKQCKNKTRITYFRRTGLLNRSINMTITTEPLFRFHCQYLLMFSNNSHRVIRNPFMKQILKEDNNISLSYKIDKEISLTSFCKEGDCIAIFEPFSHFRIPNLILVWVDLLDNFEEDLQKLRRAIQLAFSMISREPAHIKYGVIELAYGFGFQSIDFQREILREVWMLSHKTKKRTDCIYWAYDDYNAQQMLGLLQETLEQPQLTKKDTSDYF